MAKIVIQSLGAGNKFDKSIVEDQEPALDKEAFEASWQIREKRVSAHPSLYIIV